MQNNIAQLRIALVGCGNIAKMHLKYIKSFVVFSNIAVCDASIVRLDDFSKKEKIEHCFSEIETLLNTFKPDVVHVLTPPATHKDIAIKCLEAGCNVLIEKPMCLSSSEADEIIKAALKYKRSVCVDHMRLFDPLYKKAKGLLKNKDFGKIINVSASYGYDFLQRIDSDAASKWIKKLPGGVFYDLIPHPLCLIKDLIPQAKVFSTKIIRNEKAWITEMWSILSDEKSTGTLHMSLNIRPLENYLEIEAEKGTMRIDFRNFLLTYRKKTGLPNPVERIISNFSLSMQIFWGTLINIYAFMVNKLDPYAGMREIISTFYISINSGSALPVEAESAKEMICMVEEMFRNENSPLIEEKVVSVDKADVLVTGGTGFIGRKLVNSLIVQGYRVRIMTRKALNEQEKRQMFTEPQRVFPVVGDISNLSDVRKACMDIPVVFHLAAAMKGDWNNFLDSTVTGTKNILTVFKELKIEKLVYVSTLNVYNAAAYPNGKVINEDFSLEPFPERRGAYSNAKSIAEFWVRESMTELPGKIVIVRPGLVYGAEGDLFPKDIGFKIGQKLVLVLGMGKRRIPFVYLNNLVDALTSIMNSKLRMSGIYNIVDSDYPTQKEYIKLYSKYTGSKLFILFVPFWFVMVLFFLIDQVFRVFLGKRLFLCYKLSCISRSSIHSIDKLKNDFKMVQRFGFEDALKESLSSKRGEG